MTQLPPNAANTRARFVRVEFAPVAFAVAGLLALLAVPASAEVAETAAGLAGALPGARPEKPLYAVKSRFSGTAAVISFTTVKPRPVAPRADGGKPGAARIATTGRMTAPGAVLVSRPGAGRGVSLTSGFGMRGDPFNGTARAHRGLDLAAPYGSPVIATSPGVVARAGWMGGYGNCVIVDHGGGVETRYGHLAAITVAPGQQIGRGGVLGYVGSTGRSTGPHLHYEVRVNGAAVNPLAR